MYIYLLPLGPSSHPHPCPTPLGHRAQSETSVLHNSFPPSIWHMVVYICWCYSLNSSHPFLSPLCPQVHSLCFHLYSCPTSGSFQISQFFPSGNRSIRASVSASVLPVTSQDWFPLGLPGWISLQSEGFSRVFSNTTVQKHQFFSAQPSLWSNSHIHTWLLEKP